MRTPSPGSAPAVILARGNSKRIANKNLKLFRGRSLVAGCIATCLQARNISQVYVSSDSPAILQISERVGAIPIVRPQYLAHDFTQSEAAWLHALDEIKSLTGSIPLHFIAVQATSPLLTPEFLDSGLKLSHEHGWSRDVFSASELLSLGVWKQNKIYDKLENDWSLLTYDANHRPRSQEAVRLVVENGAFYVMSSHQLKLGKSRLARNPIPMVMPWWTAPEVDNLEDLLLIERLAEQFLP